MRRKERGILLAMVLVIVCSVTLSIAAGMFIATYSGPVLEDGPPRDPPTVVQP